MSFELKKSTISHLMALTFIFYIVDMQLMKIHSKSLMKIFLLRMRRLLIHYNKSFEFSVAKEGCNTYV